MSPDAPMGYELRIAGHLDQHWSTWFGGLALTLEADGTTTLRGVVADQSEVAQRAPGLRPERSHLLPEPDDVLGQRVHVAAVPRRTAQRGHSHDERRDGEQRRGHHDQEHVSQTTMQR